jgi:diguanylate cyclase (GGDEF)-like protein
MNKKNRFMMVLAALLITGFVFTSVISYYMAHKSLAEQIAGNTLPLTSDNIYSEIQQDLLRPIFISSLMAHDTFVQDWVLDGEIDPEKMVRYLAEIQQRYGTMTCFFVSNNTHKYYHSSGVLKTVDKKDPQDDWYFSMSKVIQDYQINIDLDTADMSSMAVFINHKVYDYKGRYIGTIGVGLGVESVKNTLETYRQRYGRTIFFTDRQGQTTLVGKDFDGPENLRDIPELANHTTQILTSPSAALTYKEKGHTIYFNSRFVDEFGWYLIVLENENVGETRIQKTMLINIALSLAITAIALVIAGITLGNDQKKLETMATTDKLTGLSNRQMFDFLFNKAIKSSRRHSTPLALLLIDIDQFKKVNDTYGHQAGDQILQMLATGLDDILRSGDDVIFRWGGEEFLVLCTNCNAEQAVQLAERIRTRVEALSIDHDHTTINVSVSIGAAQHYRGDDVKTTISRADRALYQAKNEGRNRIILADK